MLKLFPFVAALVISLPLHAEPAPPPAANSQAMSEGVVQGVDAAAGKIILKHGPLANLGMGPMTMMFRAQPPELLAKIKTGDKVKFHAERVGGVFVVTALEKAQ